ncbi:MAG: CopG family transcriptional regulator [Firmicutes bacterium]|nr:CopG family transcriptional regulator [Bacillota bacterium]MBR0104884.1 CopG family transcriptional regulator [Bacillota bacterium]MBR2593549.1 CopG family transcriptional regulator [Bacillota bacterium]
MTVSLRLSEEDEKLFKDYAKNNNITLSELIRRAVYEMIEDEYDLQVYREALAEYEKDPVSYTHEEVGRMLGLK